MNFATYITEILKPIERSKDVQIRPRDLRHFGAGMTLMISRHLKWRPGRPCYDWTLRDMMGRKVVGTVEATKGGEWLAAAYYRRYTATARSAHGDTRRAIRASYMAVLAQAGIRVGYGGRIIGRGDAKYNIL